MNEWHDVLLEEIAAPARNALVGGPFGSDLVAADYSPVGVPVIRGENLALGRWVSGDFVHVSDAKARELSANTAGALDLVFTQRGANHYRQVALMRVDGDRRFVISQSQMKLTVDRTKADPLFIYYLFRAPAQQEYLQRNAIQTGVPHTNLSILRKVPLRIPSLPVQRAVSRILGALDDKIELNQRMSETLEAMVRALFKSWFVDFDPVRAKSAVQEFPPVTAIAGLFPATFERSDVGLVPTGWNAQSLGEFVRIVKGRSYSSAELVESKTALVTLKSFARGGGYRTDGLKSFVGAFRTEQVVMPGEIVIACTDVTQAADVIGRPALVRRSARFTNLVASLDTAILRPADDRTSQPFLYFLCLTDAFRDHTYAHTTGTTVLHLSKDAVPSFRFAVPPKELVRAFDSLAGPILSKLDAASEESDCLAALRDTLLPKLISGELRAPDAERLVERSV